MNENHPAEALIKILEVCDDAGRVVETFSCFRSVEAQARAVEIGGFVRPTTQALCARRGGKVTKTKVAA